MKTKPDNIAGGPGKCRHCGRVLPNVSFHETQCGFLPTIATETDRAQQSEAALKQQVEDLSMFVKRLVRQSYKYGVRNKLTDDSMNYINKIVAKCSPMRKLMEQVLK